MSERLARTEQGCRPRPMNTPQFPSATSATPQNKPMEKPCPHPRVQIVSRDEEAEYVECLECREVFESSEFKDMDIEEKASDDTDA
jgi:hypothetical protein